MRKLNTKGAKLYCKMHTDPSVLSTCTATAIALLLHVQGADARAQHKRGQAVLQNAHGSFCLSTCTATVIALLLYV
jgi:hypothetical protein